MTSQKQKILDYLEGTTKHPTADKVYKEVKKDLPRISKSTVYRILDEFVHEDKIRKLDLDVAHFDYITRKHGHFVCKKCGKVRDLETDKIPSPDRTKHGKVEKTELNHYGICNECQQ